MLSKFVKKIINKLTLKKIRREFRELKNYKTWAPPGHFYSPIPCKDELINDFLFLILIHQILKE